MAIIEELVELASKELAPDELLLAAARAIAQDLLANSCRIYLHQHDGPLILQTSFGVAGSPGGAAETLANAAVAGMSTVVSASALLVATPLVSRLGCHGALVLERANEAQEFLETDGERLSSIASQLVELVDGARLVAVIDGLELPAEMSVLALHSSGERVLEGTAAAPGVAIGKVAFRHLFPSELVRRNAAYAGEPVERERLRDALQKTQNDLLRIQAAAAGELGEEQALVFGAHLLLLSDPMLRARIEQGIQQQFPAAVAVDEAFQDIARRLRGVSDPYIQERSEDIEDLRSRVLSHLLEGDPPTSLRAQVVVSPRTSPSVIMELKAQGALGVASELGGATSHGVLLARALGVPAVTGVPDLLRQVLNGDSLIIDGDRGRVTVRPSEETLTEYATRAAVEQRTRSEFTKFRDQPARSADGVHFRLQANVALGIDLDVARENGAEGVGLYRTEFAFIARDGTPSREEQVRIYSKAYLAFPNGPISFRILDLAGDKFLSSTAFGIARSPFHGYRSIRVLFDYPHILRAQAQAFALAAGDRALRILVPMVSSLEELQRIKQLVVSAIAELPPGIERKTPSFGAMIEVPAAVEIVADLAAEVDFFSIGTNDLIQYALVVDREDARLSSPRDAFHPAILRMIDRVVQVAHRCHKEVSVCGEAAARPEIAVALLALGIDALSVSPRMIPELKQRLAGVTLRPLVASITSVLDRSCAADIERTLREVVEQDKGPAAFGSAAAGE